MLTFIGFLFGIMSWLIVIRALTSWFPNARGNAAVKLLYEITDPIMIPLSRFVPRLGAFDFSPLVAILLFRYLAVALGSPI